MTIRLESAAGEICLTIHDDGRGLARLQRRGRPSGALGMIGMRARARSAGGDVTVQSKPGQGVLIEVRVPLRRMKRIRILLADDHAVVRQGFKMILAAQTDMEIVGEAANGREAVELAEQLQPDIVVMDVAMPELNGIEATRRLAGVAAAHARDRAQHA